MNTLNKNSLTLGNKNIKFDEIISITKWKKTLKITDVNGDKYDITEEDMVNKFNELLQEKPNFVFYFNRFVNLDLVKKVKQVSNPANKIFAIEVDYGATKETFNFESAPAASQFKKEITKAIDTLNANKETSLTK